MSSINPISSVTNGKQITGLASGLDTESMVEKLLSGTQSKIDKQMQDKQQVEWKQEIYRSIIGKMDNFKTKYFTYFGSGNTNLLSSAFYNVVNTVSSSSAVKVISSSSRAANQIKINSVDQLATAYSAKSSGAVTKALEGGTLATLDAGEHSIDITLDGVKKTVKFTVEAGDTVQDIADSLNSSLENIWGDAVKFGTNTAGDGLKVTASVAGGSAISTHNIILGNTEGTETLTKLGFAEGASNKLSYNALLDEAAFSTKLMGNQFAFKINGVEIKATSKDTVGDVISRINGSAAGVKISYSSIEDKFIIESKQTGEIAGIDVEQTEGNLLSAMFGLGNGSGIAGSTEGLRESDTLVSDGTVDDTLLDAIMAAAGTGGQSFKMHVNGRQISVPIPALGDGEPAYTKESFIQAINDQLDSAFGDDSIKLELNAAGDKVSITCPNNYWVSLEGDDLQNNVTNAFGFTVDQDQKVKETTTMGQLGFAGTLTLSGTGSISINENETLGDFITRFNNMGNGQLIFDAATGGISLTGINGADVQLTGDADGKQVLQKLFGQEQLDFNTSSSVKFDQAYAATSGGQKGQNALINVNGTIVERNSNDFELDGVTIQLTAITSPTDGPIVLTTEKDTDTMIAGIKSFVEDYNSLVDELNGYITQDPNYRKYAPLTDAQKKEMSEKEIEAWEKKAKEGLLRNDINISSALGDMRSALYQSVDSAGGLALYQIGLDTSSNYKDNGKLILDEGKLREALTNNLDNVKKLFTDKEQGIGTHMSNILDEAAKVSSGSPGFLVEYAGTKDVMNTENTLSKQLQSIQDRIKTLNAKYENERARYWRQFSAMEQAMSSLNSQSSWISQQFSS